MDELISRVRSGLLEMIDTIAVNLGLAPAGAPGNLADVARFLDRTRCSADSQQLIVADVHVQEVIGIIVEGSRGRGGVGHGRGTLRGRIDGSRRVPVVDGGEPWVQGSDFVDIF